MTKPTNCRDIREIVTNITTPEDARRSFEIFMEKYRKEGTDLRMESIGNLNGKRFVLVFDWDDMG